MEDILEQNYTIYISKKDNLFFGLGLMSLKNGNGIVPVILEEEQMKIMQEFPFIEKSLEKGNILQIYRDGGSFYVKIGKVIKEGVYGEDDCFYVVEEVNYPCLFTALIKLDKILTELLKDVKQIKLKKEYRLYGQDKYTCQKYES